MMRRATVVLLLLLISLPAAAADQTPLSPDKAIALSSKLAEQKRYDDALNVLTQAERADPQNMDLRIAAARVLSYEGQYDRADAILKPIINADPNNTDAIIAQSYIEYYRGDLDAAENGFAGVLRAYPTNADAREGLKTVQAAKKADPDYRWIVDAGYEHSFFARRDQDGWDGEFAQVTRLFDHGNTALHGRLEYYDEFDTTDEYYELGVDHAFTPYLNGYFYAGHTVDPSFKATWRVLSGGSVRLITESKLRPAFWATLDGREEVYSDTGFDTINPGGRFEFRDWSLASNLVSVRQWGTSQVFGWNVRVDTPTWEKFHFYVGYSDAPDVENAISVYTATVYGGVSYDLTDAYTLHLGYTHDDRENSYIRHVIDANVTARF